MRTIAEWCLGSLAGLLVSTLSWGATEETYSIGWHTIDGGGGTSVGGGYAVTGTVGQPDAGAMSGDEYALQGGFWEWVEVAQAPHAPWLAIARLPTTAVNLTWPAASMGWRLQVNAEDVASPNWTDVTVGIEDIGPLRTLSVSPSTGQRFYRLHRP